MGNVCSCFRVYDSENNQANMSSRDKREFTNEFSDYAGQELLNPQGLVSDELAVRLKDDIRKKLAHLDTGLESTDKSDYSVYTGSTGIALLHFHLYHVLDKEQKPDYLRSALSLIERPLRHLKGRKFTFLCGDAGPLSLGAVVYDKLGMKDESMDCIKRLVHLHKEVCSNPDLADELLTGRCGYLYSLLFVQQHLGEDKVEDKIIEKVCKSIIQSGESLARESRSKCPLMYEWHDKVYLGAAHGLVGIFCMLMQAKNEAIKPYLEGLVRPSIDWLITLKFPSGNYPSSIGSAGGDKLIHWCHGAPGWIYMFIMAYQLFNDPKYLDAAKTCAEVIWKRGILRKGYGICHGTAGNGYAFLAMYRITADQKYLHRAVKFAEWCFAYGQHGCPQADRPYSLFEGLAGTIYYLADLLDPKRSRYPAFEL